MGDIFGGGGDDNYEIRGTVDYVDPNSRSVYLTNVSGYSGSMLSSGGGNSVRVYFDDQTPVSYQGQTYRVTDLERGDVVTVRVDDTGNQLVAESMTVTHDVSGDGSLPTYGSAVRGTVRYVDTARRTIEVDRGGGSLSYIEYDSSTPVYFNNQTYRASDLERGDEIDVRVRDLGSGRLAAESITVVRSVSSSGGVFNDSSSNGATIRGTVVHVDTARRTIELESASWRSNFNTGASGGSRVIVSYDTNTSVDVSGRLYPVSGLERGDVIEVQVSNANSSMPFAQRIFLVRNVRQ